MLTFAGRRVQELSSGATLEIDANSGAASLRIPVLPPPGRGNLAPPLVLAYLSGAVNSPFGAGWSLSGLPAIGLDTRRHVPRWDGSDGYALAGDELVPWLADQGDGWAPRGFERGDFSVLYLRSRRGSSRMRVEKWLHRPTGRVHFRSRDADNTLTVYGARPDAAARVADPDDEWRTLVWLPELLLDPFGNALWIDYAAETADGIDRAAPGERRRPPLAQRYLKRIRYGNSAPLQVTDAVLGGAMPAGMAWHFQHVLDYGDHDPAAPPAAAPDRPWPVRADPFSSNRNGFEVRTYRLCRRFLSFHDFAELGPGPTPVAALALSHAEDPAGSTLTAITRIGYRRDAGGAIVAKAIPPLRLSYAPAAADTELSELPAMALANVPAGFAQRRVGFVDLYGEGVCGILSETDRAWFYKANLGDGAFAAQALVGEKPSARTGSAGLGDMDADGDTDLSELSGRFAGLYERDRERDAWRPFRAFPSFPHIEAMANRARWVDLNGDGLADLVLSRDDCFVWFASDGEGFLPPVAVARPDGPDAVPTLRSDAAMDFFFADMDGDGLADFVRIRNGCAEYWPGRGNGRFGDRVVMDGAPVFAPDDEFDATRLRFVDLDGSGTADLVYLGHGEVRLWHNASGNRLVAGARLAGMPYFDALANVRIFDLLGNGRSCLVWSSPLPGSEAPLHYLPLTPVVPPRLLVKVEDRLGRETRLTYSSSARHYLRDVADGRGWRTRLPTHRMVVDRCEEVDLIGGTSSVRAYAYHDGYYDGDERTARGFGQVDITDADVFGGPDPPPDTFAAPSLTRLWFHLGTPMWDRHLPTGTYTADPGLPWLAPHVVADAAALGSDEIEDGLRALAGRPIRRELYALDAHGLPGAHPIEVFQATHRLRRVQPAWNGADAAFFAAGLETATWVYEQAPGDPRVHHSLVLAFDETDQPSRVATIGYARRAGRPRDAAAQDRHFVAVHDTGALNIDEPDRYELAILVDNRNYEVVGLRPGAGGRFTVAQLTAPAVAAALAAALPHEATPPDDPNVAPQARLTAASRKLYWNAARDAALPLGQVTPVGTLVHHDEVACFSPGFIAGTLGGRVDDAALTALGYLTQDGLWWQQGEVHSFGPPAQFSQRVGVRRNDGGETRFAYDNYALVITGVSDGFGNAEAAMIDYHRLAPWQITDPNGNVQQVRYDPLGVIVTATRTGHVGDQPWGFDALDAVAARTPTDLAAATADPAQFLQGAGEYSWYDLDAFDRDGSPTLLVEFARDGLPHDGAGGAQASNIALGVAYFDGLGRALQQKSLVEPGPAISRDAAGAVALDAAGNPVLAAAATRWRASGHIVYDGKQRPIRQYDAFFTATPAYEGDAVLQRFGNATLVAYDVAGRLAARHYADGTLARAVIGAWQIEEADANDTVLDSTWRAVREALPADAPERQALEEARPHAGTSRLVFLDPLGRPVGKLEQGGATAADRRTEVHIDIDGRALEVVDPRGLVAFRYRRDMLGRLIQQDSVDAGQSFSLPDAYDRDARLWDGRGFVLRRGFDTADRPLFVEVSGGDGPAPLDNRVEEYVYGDTLADRADAQRRNLLGRPVTLRDGAGEATVDRYDPAGNQLGSSHRQRTAVDAEPDWRAAEPVEAETIAVAAQFDPLGRVRSEQLADGSTRSYEYLAGGALARVRLTTPDGKLAAVPILDGVTVGAGGEMLTQRLGNGVQIASTYAPETLRLAIQTATRGARTLQQIGYTYDPVGNIVRITDAAQEGAGALIAGIAVPARRDYTYDAHYRLRSATGRVHQALLQWDMLPGAAHTVKGSRLIGFNDGAAVERYTRNFDYDAGGNLTRMRHLGTSRGWTTDFWVSPNSNRSLPALDPGGNPIANPETKFDAGGNLRELPHLRAVEWNWSGMLARAVAVARPGSTDDAERYVYGAGGQRTRRITTRLIQAGLVETIEKAVFGDAERRRIRRNGQLVLERWTLSVGDGNKRLALVHRWTRDDLHREVDDIADPRVRYQLTTHLRSSVMELDDQGALVTYEEFFPHGDTAFVVGDDAREVDRREYRHCGRERDDFTGFYYYGYRYLVPWMGRWLSPDPIGPEDDLNLYQFVRGDPIANADAEGLETEGTVRLGSVSAKINKPEEAMRQFNNARALQLGVLVTQVKRLPSGDWLIVATTPLPPNVRATAERLHGDIEAAQTIEDLKASLQQLDKTDGSPGDDSPWANADPDAGKPPPDDAGSGNGSPGTKINSRDATDLGDGAGGKGSQGTGKDAAGTGGKPQDGSDAPDDQSVKDGKAGGIGVGTGKGVDVGAGTGNDPNAPPAGGGGNGTGAKKSTGKAPKGAGTDGGGTGPKGSGPGVKGGDPKGVPGGQGTGPVTGNPTQDAKTNNGNAPGDNGGQVDPRLTPSATGAPPQPGVSKQGTDPNGVVDGGTADTGQPNAPGDPANTGSANGSKNGRAGGGGDATGGVNNPGGGPGGGPQGRNGGTPDGSKNGLIGGGGDHELPWYLGWMNYVGKGLQVVGALLEIAGGLAMLIAPEPTVTKVAGIVLLLHGLDSLQAAIRGDRTLTAHAATGIAKHVFHASDDTAHLVGDITDIAIPLIAGGIGALGKTGALGAPKVWGWTQKIPFASNWYMTGAANDAAYQALSKSDKALYELGQRTLTDKAYNTMLQELGQSGKAAPTVAEVVARGKFIKAASKGLTNFTYRFSTWKFFTFTLWTTGPTPGVRAWGSVLWPWAAAVFGGEGTILRHKTQQDRQEW